MNEKIGITDIIDMMIRRWWIWAVCAVALSIIAFVYTEIFVDPLYKTEGAMYVNSQRTQGIDYSTGQLNSSEALVKNYSEILKRRTFLSTISDDLDGKYSTNVLKGMITFESVSGTQVMTVRVIGKDPQDIYDICHSILVHAPDELISVINAGSVKVLDDGQVPTAPISPDVKRNSLIAFVIGMILGALVILLLELFDTRIKTRDDIINRYDEPLLGEIPEVLPTEGGNQQQ